MIRAVNSSLDPETRRRDARPAGGDWVPAPCWLVLAVDDAGRVRPLAARGLTPALADAAQAVGEWVMQKRRGRSRPPTSSTDRRLARRRRQRGGRR